MRTKGSFEHLCVPLVLVSFCWPDRDAVSGDRSFTRDPPSLREQIVSRQFESLLQRNRVFSSSRSIFFSC